MNTPYDRRNQVLDRAEAALGEGDHYMIDGDWDAACSAWRDGMAQLDILDALDVRKLRELNSNRSDPRGAA